MFKFFKKYYFILIVLNGGFAAWNMVKYLLINQDISYLIMAAINVGVVNMIHLNIIDDKIDQIKKEV